MLSESELRPSGYRFTVPLPSGKRMRALLLPLPRRKKLFWQLEWEGKQASHGGEIGMSARCAAELEGTSVTFKVEQLEGPSWSPCGTAGAVVRGGFAKARLRAEHPQLRTSKPGRNALDLSPGRLRFRVIPGAAPEPIFSKLAWEKMQVGHGADVGMSAHCSNFEGSKVTFLVEQLQGRSWAACANVEAVVRDGVAQGTLRAQHPQLPSAGQASRQRRSALSPGRLRFRVVPGVREPVTRPELQSPAFSELAWEKKRVEHGADVRMTARCPELEGKKVRFLVEQLQGGSWSSHSSVEAVVQGGFAKATLRASHPQAPASGKPAAGLPSARLRFRLVQA